MPEIIGNEKDVEWVRTAVMPTVAAKVLGSYKDTKSWLMMIRFDPGMEFPAHTSVPKLYLHIGG